VVGWGCLVWHIDGAFFRVVAVTLLDGAFGALMARLATNIPRR
jgi:hypothetical protein